MKKILVAVFALLVLLPSTAGATDKEVSMDLIRDALEDYWNKRPGFNLGLLLKQIECLLDPDVAVCIVVGDFSYQPLTWRAEEKPRPVAEFTLVAKRAAPLRSTETRHLSVGEDGIFLDFRGAGLRYPTSGKAKDYQNPCEAHERWFLSLDAVEARRHRRSKNKCLRDESTRLSVDVPKPSKGRLEIVTCSKERDANPSHWVIYLENLEVRSLELHYSGEVRYSYNAPNKIVRGDYTEQPDSRCGRGDEPCTPSSTEYECETLR